MKSRDEAIDELSWMTNISHEESERILDKVFGDIDIALEYLKLQSRLIERYDKKIIKKAIKNVEKRRNSHD